MLKKIKVRSQIIHGNKMGRKIGFPTANLDTKNLEIFDFSKNNFIQLNLNQSQKLLEKGIYGGYSNIFIFNKQNNDFKLDKNFPQKIISAIYIGPNETFEKNAFKLEVHLLDFDSDIYDKFLETEIVHKIRGDKKFDSIQAIQIQIQKDCQKIREML